VSLEIHLTASGLSHPVSFHVSMNLL